MLEGDSSTQVLTISNGGAIDLEWEIISSGGDTLELDVGEHNTTFSNMTRGYWFLAPTNFTINELRVPTDIGMEQQYIQVVRFEDYPTPWPTRTAGMGSDVHIPGDLPMDSRNTEYTTLLYSDSFSGEDWVPCEIIITEGDYIGLLGVRGGGNVNSYGTSAVYPSMIGDIDVDLTRLVYQGTINDGQTDGELFYETTGSIARIEMKYSLGSSSLPNWLSTNPTSGTIPADSSADVTVTFNATAMDAGDYSATISLSLIHI